MPQTLFKIKAIAVVINYSSTCSKIPLNGTPIDDAIIKKAIKKVKKDCMPIDSR